jgi:hypothetical protein
MTSGSRSRQAAGLAVGALGSIGAAAALVGVRGESANADVALMLAVLVLAGALIGGRSAGTLSALAAAMSFDFFHTRPYGTLKISDVNDVISTVLLLLVGLVIGQVGGSWHRLGDRLHDDQGEIRRLHRVAELASRGEATEDMILVVTAELIDTLHLDGCSYEPTPPDNDTPLLESGGTVRSSTHWFAKDGFELPRDGVQLVVTGAGRTHGRFMLTPSPGVGVSVERRLIAIALADQLGAVLGARASPMFFAGAEQSALLSTRKPW